MKPSKEIAVIICNYNKKDYLERCILSLKKQSGIEFDIFVVDNASTDGSSEMVEELFESDVILLKNDTNLGGAGGFNTGMRIASKDNYKYLVLLDNDVTLAENCISVLYDDMENNMDIGIMGAKILKMDEPDIIQEFAPTVNFEDLTFELNHNGEKDDGSLPHIMQCDYVPACALVVRNEVVRKIGVMPEENFIYYDDITWATRCRRAGYKVAADSKAVVWHKGGAKVNPTTFGNYYLTRNKTLFFMQYADMFISEDKKVLKEKVAKKIIFEMCEGLYACANNEMPNIAKTRFDAFLDAMNLKFGKVLPQRIREKEDNKKRLREILRGKSRILIYGNGLKDDTRRIINSIIELNNGGRASAILEIVDENCEDAILGHEIKLNPTREIKDYDLILHACHHIYELKINSLDRIWVDRWGNILITENDFFTYSMFKMFYDMFYMLFKERIEEAVENISS